MLSTFVDRYATLRPVSPECIRNYRKHVHDFEAFTGHPVRLCELSPQLVDSWLTNKLRAGRSPYYVVGLRSSVLAVWRAAWEEGLAPRVPRAVRIRRPDLLVRCWTPTQVAELVVAARRIRGHFARTGLPRGQYMATAITATWYAGVRRGDLHRIRHDQIRPDGTFEIVQHKTGRRHLAQFPQSLMRDVRKWSRPPGAIWPRPGSDEIIRAIFRQLVDSVASGRVGFLRGCWRDIRRSAENSAERRYPGRGHLLAGHERRTFERYYRATEETPGVAPENISGFCPD